MLQLMHKHPVSRARYSFTQLSELEWMNLVWHDTQFDLELSQLWVRRSTYCVYVLTVLTVSGQHVRSTTGQDNKLLTSRSISAHLLDMLTFSPSTFLRVISESTVFISTRFCCHTEVIEVTHNWRQNQNYVQDFRQALPLPTLLITFG